jgi:hypothetical protein
MPEDLPDASFLDIVTAPEEGDTGANRDPEKHALATRGDDAETRSTSETPRVPEAASAYF